MEKKMIDLRRLDEQMYLQHTPYMCDYWFEHKFNFKAMLAHLVSSENLARLSTKAAEGALQYNRMTKAVSPEYNEQVVAKAYARITELIVEKDDVGKNVLVELMDGVYGAIDALKQRKDATLASAFDEESGWFRVVEPLESIFGAEFESDEKATSLARTQFLPQLIVYFLRYLHLYDSALQGQNVEEFMAGGISEERRAEHQRTPAAVERFWQTLRAKPRESDNDKGKGKSKSNSSGESAESEAATSSSTSTSAPRMPKQVEMKFLTDNREKVVNSLVSTWVENEPRFVRKWCDAEQLNDERRAWLCHDARDTVVKMKAGALENAAVYCPELHPDRLSESDGQPLIELVKVAMRMDNDEFADDASSIVEPLKRSLDAMGKGDMMPSIAVSRHIMVAAFCEAVIRLTLQLPLPSHIASATEQSAEDAERERREFEEREKQRPRSKVRPPLRKTPPVGPSQTSKVVEESKEEKKEDAKVKRQCDRCSLPAPHHCSRCRKAFYCSTTCQRAEWPLHKVDCVKST
jgi:MYND finger